MVRIVERTSVFFLVTIFYLNILKLSSALDGDLFLTPMIKKGELDKAKAAAQDNLKLAHVKTASDTPVLSYSGFITVSEEYNSNIFFVYVPAMESPATAPLILHSNEFYGVSAMRNVFAESGPFIVGENGILVDNPNSWTKKYSVIYIDAPVGTGFSFTDNKKGEAKNDEEEALEVVAALTQIFTLFPELNKKDMYLAGDDYGCVFATNLILALENDPGGFKPNIKGMLFASPMFDASTQLDIADYFYYLGLMDEPQKKIIQKNEEEIRALAKQNKFQEAADLHWATRIAPNSLFRNFTGFSSFRHAVHSVDHPSYTRYEDFVKTKELHTYLHVGLHKFVNMDFEVFYGTHGAWFANNMKKFEKVLAKGTYKILIFATQFDLCVTHFGVLNMIQRLEWPGVKDFVKAPRTVWKSNEEVTGYVKMGGGITFVTLRNAGSIPTINKPESVIKLVHHLIKGEKL